MDFNKHPKETERLLESRLGELLDEIREKERCTPTREECVQPEAYCLMKYASSDGGIVEWLWNSRDGVTPFCILAKDGKTELRHVEWRRDKFRPNHRLQPGDRYFGPITRRAAKRYALERIESMDGTMYESKGRDREILFEQLLEEMLKDETPDILVFQGDEEQKQYEELKAEQSNKVPGGLVEWVRKKLVDAQEAYEISHIHTCSAKHTPNRDELMECVAHQKQMEGRRDVYAELSAKLEGSSTAGASAQELLDTLEGLVKDEGWNSDVVLCYDDEDGFWLASLERGSIHVEEPKDLDDAKRGSLAEAIKAAMSSIGRPT